jgi:hypothetical protein
MLVLSGCPARKKRERKMEENICIQKEQKKRCNSSE